MLEFEPSLIAQLAGLVLEYGLAFGAGAIFGTVTTGVFIIAKLHRDGVF